QLEHQAFLRKARAQCTLSTDDDTSYAGWLRDDMVPSQSKPREGRRPRVSRVLGRNEDAVATAAEHLEGFLLRGKVLGDLAGGLGLAQDEIAAVAQGVGEELECALLQLRRKVDQHVATQH